MFNGMGTMYNKEDTIKEDGIYFDDTLIDEFMLYKMTRR